MGWLLKTTARRATQLNPGRDGDPSTARSIRHGLSDQGTWVRWGTRRRPRQRLVDGVHLDCGNARRTPDAVRRARPGFAMASSICTSHCSRLLAKASRGNTPGDGCAMV